MVTPDAKRKAVAHACTVHAVSQRRACLALTIDRSTVRYTSTRPDDALLRKAMKAVAGERRRFGYRRIHIMLDRQGIVMNQKKLRRLYREEKLQVRRRGGRKRALGTRRPMLVPDRANARWSLDFLSDTISDGRRFRVLAIVDDYPSAATATSGICSTSERVMQSALPRLAPQLERHGSGACRSVDRQRSSSSPSPISVQRHSELPPFRHEELTPMPIALQAVAG